MDNLLKQKSCNNCAHETSKIIDDGQTSRLKGKPLRAIPSIVLGFLIAFFPKCPVCWAVYMSMLGNVGLAQLPYVKWLLPVFSLLFGLHLFILLKASRRNGYGPIFLNVVGIVIILVGRSTFAMNNGILITGMLFIVVGSFWSNFSNRKAKENSRLRILHQEQQIRNYIHEQSGDMQQDAL